MTNSTAELPELAGAHEAGEILGMSSKYVSAMASRRLKGESEYFPRPAAVLAMGPVWLKSDIEAFGEARKQGSRIPPPGARAPALLAGYDPELIERTIDSPQTGLTERQRKLLRYRMGFEDGVVLGLKQAAEKLSVSAQTANNDQRGAFEKMKAALGISGDDLRSGQSSTGGRRRQRPPAGLAAHDPELIERAIDSPQTGLTERQRQVLRYRMGLEDGTVLGMDAVGQKLGISPITATRHQQAALKKVKAALRKS